MKDVNPFCVQPRCMGEGGGTRHKIACCSTQNRLPQKNRVLFWYTKIPCRPGREATGGKGRCAGKALFFDELSCYGLSVGYNL